MNQAARIIALATALSGSCVLTSADAGVNAFTPLGPEGGVVYDVQFHPTQSAIAYMGSEAGFFRSADFGASWRATEGVRGHVIDFAVDPANGDRIFMTAHDGVLVSTNAGMSATRLTTSPSNGLATSNLEVSGDGVVYVVSNNFLFRSGDGGSSWQQRPLPANLLVAVLRVDPSNSALVYALRENTGYRSANGGESWEPMPLPGQTNDLVIAHSPRRLLAVTNSGVRVSVNEGAQWTPVGPDPYIVQTVAPHPTDPSILYAGIYPTGLHRWDEQSAQWTSLHGDARTGALSAVAVHPTQPSLLLIGGDEGLARSTDGGMTWSAANSGFIGQEIDEFVRVPGSDRVYVQTPGAGIYVLEGGAATTRPLNLQALADATTGPNSLLIFDLVAHGPSPDHLWAAMNSGFARSTDGGEDWEFVFTFDTIQSGALHRLESPALDPQLLVASSFVGMRRSINGGATWAPLNGLPERAQASSLVFPASSASVVYAGVVQPPVTAGRVAPQGMYRSTNGGADWTAINANLPDETYVLEIAVDPRTEQTVYSATDKGLFKSLDGGASWSQIRWLTDTTQHSTNSVALDASNPDIVYVAQDMRIARSIDGGAAWQVLQTALPTEHTGARTLAVHPAKSQTLLVGTRTKGALELTFGADLALSASSPAPIPASPDAKTLNYSVQHLGPYHATQVRTTIQLPASAGAISASTSAGACTVAGVTITCTQPTLLAGSSVSITVNSTHPDAGDGAVAARVEAGEADPDPTNNELNGVPVRGQTDVAVSASGPASATEGASLRYSVQIQNVGPNDATGVSASIQLATGLSVTNVAASHGSCSTASSVATCTLPTLARAASATVTLDAVAGAPGAYSVSVSATTTSPESSSANNASTVSTTVSARAPSSNGGGGGGGAANWTLLSLLAGALLARRRAAQAV